MILSVAEKNALLKRQRELEEYENEMVRRYQASQAARSADLHAMKMAAEEQREIIFNILQITVWRNKSMSWKLQEPCIAHMQQGYAAPHATRAWTLILDSL